MGLTVRRKTAKNLAVRRKNERILAVSRKKFKKINRKKNLTTTVKALRSFYESDVLCVFVFWQREKPIETGNVGSVYTIYVVARVDRRFDSSRPSFTTFMPKGQTGCNGCSESNIKFLSQWGRKACRTIQDQSKSHGRTQITFFIQKKCYRQTGMAFKDIQYMTPLPPDELSKREEETMKDWVENYRPVRQRTVRSETTKDKAGALPPAVYSNSNTDVTTRVSFQADQVEETPAVSSDMPSAVTDVPVLNFVSDATVPQLTLASTADYNQVEEYESDSDDSDNDVDIDSEELVIGKPVMTRSGRQVRVWTRFDV